MSWDVKDADEKFKDLSARGISHNLLELSGREAQNSGFYCLVVFRALILLRLILNDWVVNTFLKRF
ncbi:MAG: hypothetical protein LW832_06550 [Parachlamydia sp.]|jgi:hypothetical protein|nr:hypothetical protein [Parachlamydia sp.]